MKGKPREGSGVGVWLGGQCSDALGDFQALLALSDDEEAVSRAQGYIDLLRSCEPPPGIPLLV